MSTMLRHARSNVIAYLALFTALGGASYAAVALPKNSVGAKQIKANAVTSTKIKDGSLRAADFASGQLPAGAKGEKGDTGATGATGAKGEKGDTGAQGPVGPSTGAAGGDLSGSYPNPSIGDGKVTTAKLAAVPAVKVQLSTTATAIANGSQLVVPWDVEAYDNASMHDAGQPTRLVAPVAGVYAVDATARWEGDSDGFRILRVLKGGVTTNEAAGSQMTPNQEGGFFTVQTVSGHVRLEAGEFVTVRVDQTGVAGGTDLLGGANPATYASMTWVSN